MDSKRGLARTGLLGVMLASALSGCCIMTPLASVCAPGGFGGGGGGGHRQGGHRHFHGAVPPATDGAAAVAAVEAGALAGMYAYTGG